MDEEKKAKLLSNASGVARSNFRFLWREYFWDCMREEGKCDYLAVKCTVSDDSSGVKEREQFWLINPLYDGVYVYGSVNVAPSIITNVEQGSALTVPLDRIEDWIYVKEGRAYGGYTINMLRSFLKGHELEMYDQSWGFTFGSPLYVDKFPKNAVIAETELEEIPDKKFFGITIKKGKTIEEQEEERKAAKEAAEKENPPVDWNLDHPDALSNYSKFEEYYTANPAGLNLPDDNGFTPLHQHALAGNRHIVKLLLSLGADTSIQTPHGHTARELAKLMQWMKVVAILS